MGEVRKEKRLVSGIVFRIQIHGLCLWGLITAMLRYVSWYCSSRSALISFFFTFRLVVKQRTPSFIILSKESSFRASFLQRYQVERWLKFRTVPYLTQLSSGKIELAFVRSSWKKTEELPILVVQSKHRARADKHSISRPSSTGSYAPTSSWCQATARLILNQAVRFCDDWRMAERGIWLSL